MDIAGALTNGGALILIYIALIAAAVIFEIWLIYTIIWRAVRRGLREHDLNPTGTKGPRREERYRGNPRNW